MFFFTLWVNTLFLEEQRTNSNQLINIIHFRLFHVLYTPCVTLIRVATITVNVSFLATYLSSLALRLLDSSLYLWPHSTWYSFWCQLLLDLPCSLPIMSPLRTENESYYYSYFPGFQHSSYYSDWLYSAKILIERTNSGVQSMWQSFECHGNFLPKSFPL